MKRLALALLAALSAIPSAAQADPIQPILDNAAEMSAQQIARQCMATCRQSIFGQCTQRILMQQWVQCHDPDRAPHPQGPEVEALLCSITMSNHAALCASTVSGCAIECVAEALHPDHGPIELD